MNDNKADRIFFTSIPKCGKNLLYSMFQKLGFSRHSFSTQAFEQAAYELNFDGISYIYPTTAEFDVDEKDERFDLFAEELKAMSPRSVFHRHLLPLPKFYNALAAVDIKPILIIRDPRDAVLSAANFAINQATPQHIVTLLASRNLKDTIKFLLIGEEGTVPFADQYDAFYAWLQEPNTLVIKFEDLIGEQGGGSKHRQEMVVRQILNHVGLTTNDDIVATACDGLFNTRAGTFYRGKIGSWGGLNDPELEDLFMEHAGSLGDRWGYAG